MNDAPAEGLDRGIGARESHGADRSRCGVTLYVHDPGVISGPDQMSNQRFPLAHDALGSLGQGALCAMVRVGDLGKPFEQYWQNRSVAAHDRSVAPFEQSGQMVGGPVRLLGETLL